MKGLTRSTALKIAAVLAALWGIWAIASNLPMLAQGAAWAAQAPGYRPPYLASLLSVIAGVLGIVGAYGAWNQQRWGAILIFVVTLFNVWTSLAGILFARTPNFRIDGTIGMIVSILIVIFCLWRERKPVSI